MILIDLNGFLAGERERGGWGERSDRCVVVDFFMLCIFFGYSEFAPEWWSKLMRGKQEAPGYQSIRCQAKINAPGEDEDQLCIPSKKL